MNVSFTLIDVALVMQDLVLGAGKEYRCAGFTRQHINPAKKQADVRVIIFP